MEKKNHNTSNQNTYSRGSVIGTNGVSGPKTTKSYQNFTIREAGSLNNMSTSKTASTNNLYEMQSSDKMKTKNSKALSNNSNLEDNGRLSQNCHRTTTKPTSINEIGRRYSIDSNLRTAAFHRANDSSVQFQSDVRRQSMDSVSSGEPPKPTILHGVNTKLVPSMTKQKVLNSILLKTQAVVGKYSTSVTNNASTKPSDKLRSSIGLCFRPQQHSETASEDNNYDSRLRHLEDKIRKHTANFKATASRSDKIGKPHGGDNVENAKRKITPLNYSIAPTPNKKFDLFRTTSEYNTCGAVPLKHASSKYDIGGAGDGRVINSTSNIVVGDRNYSSNKFNKNSNNYGVIRATDLFKIRSPEIIS